MGWLIKRLAWCALAGALLATLGSAAWQGYQVLAAGYALDSVAPLTMALEVMQLHIAAGYGALAGVACGVVPHVWRLARALLRRLRHAQPAADAGPDADTLIRSERTQRAEAYLSTLQRRALDNVAVSAEQAPGAPEVENMFTTGALSYRVLAYRALSAQECAQAVHDALQRGLVREPQPGGTATVLTSIGR